MDKEIAEKWVKALRSGKYEQGKNTLCSIDEKGNKKYCCLGVLNEVLGIEGVLNEEESVLYYDKEEQSLNVKALKLAKMESTIGDIKGYDICLAVLNDDGQSFETIADTIEHYVEEL